MPVHDLRYVDKRPVIGSTYFHIFGTVYNVGTKPVYECRLYISLYQGRTMAKETHICLGTIDGLGSTDVDAKIYYNGPEITGVGLNLKCKK